MKQPIRQRFMLTTAATNLIAAKKPSKRKRLVYTGQSFAPTTTNSPSLSGLTQYLLDLTKEQPLTITTDPAHPNNPLLTSSYYDNRPSDLIELPSQHPLWVVWDDLTEPLNPHSIHELPNAATRYMLTLATYFQIPPAGYDPFDSDKPDSPPTIALRISAVLNAMASNYLSLSPRTNHVIYYPHLYPAYYDPTTNTYTNPIIYPRTRYHPTTTPTTPTATNNTNNAQEDPNHAL